MAVEMVVLLDEKGVPIGSAPKVSVHTTDTPLHLAFSCYLFNADGEVLITRRSLEKITWPGVWTNSFCGHPAPGESLIDSIHRRAADELRTKVKDVTEAVPDFTYRATDASGIVEFEVCPVYVARIDGGLQPNASEVVEWRWVDLASLIRAVADAPYAFSPWMEAQLPTLVPTLGAVPVQLGTNTESWSTEEGGS